MRFIGLVISALLVLSIPVTVQAFQMRSYTTGQQLYQVCSGDRDSCYLYVYGVLDMLMLNDDTNSRCTFNPEGVSGDKAVNAVLSYIRSHQDRMDWSAAALVQNAIRSKYPCAKKKSAGQPSAGATDDATSPTPEPSKTAPTAGPANGQVP